MMSKVNFDITTDRPFALYEANGSYFWLAHQHERFKKVIGVYEEIRAIANAPDVS